VRSNVALAIVRLVVLAVATAAGFGLGPSMGITQNKAWLAGAGFLLGVLVVVLEWQARRIPVDRLFWGAAGGILGVAFGLGLGTALGAVVPGAGPLGRGLFALLLAYLGTTVTLAKRDTLHARRQVLAMVPDPVVVKKLFDTIAARLGDRNGGYTRILKAGRRPGDRAPMAILELVDRPETPKEKEKKGAKGKKKAAAAAG